MEIQQKSQRTRKKGSAFVYLLPESRLIFTQSGEPILFEGQQKYVCGGCLLLLLNLGVHSLVTLTFAGDSSDVALASDSLGNFQRGLRSRYPDSHSVFVPEVSPRGRIHFHGLLFGLPETLGDTRKGKTLVQTGTERSERTLAKLWGKGFVDCIKTDGSGRLAGYISKYIVKGSGHVLLAGIRLVRMSKGFPQEFVIKDSPMFSYIVEGLHSQRLVSTWKGENVFLGNITHDVYTKD